jgi:hypothetical protein
MNGKNDSEKRVSATSFTRPIKHSKRVDFEDRFYRIVSLGTIVSGALACLASVGVGMGLMLAGTMILAEL